MNGCENCQHKKDCPLIPGEKEGWSKKCPIWIEKYAEKRILEMVKKSGRVIDRCPRFEDLKYNTNNIKKEVDLIRLIPSNKNHLFWICSPYGTGKTHCLLSFVFDCLCKRIDAYYVTSKHLRDIYLGIQNAHLYSDNELMYEIRDIMDAKIVSVDDFSHEGISETGFFQRNIEGLLTSTAKKIILASNIPITDENFPYKNDEWIMDRINAAVQITWYGKSLREPGR
jgi:DNA replication protein DnaC